MPAKGTPVYQNCGSRAFETAFLVVLALTICIAIAAGAVACKWGMIS